MDGRVVHDLADAERSKLSAMGGDRQSKLTDSSSSQGRMGRKQGGMTGCCAGACVVWVVFFFENYLEP